MRCKPSQLTLLPFTLTLFLLGMAVLGQSTPAQAQSRHGDRVHADSFGNLIVYGSSGYKRIVVGKGYMARELAEYVQPRGDSDVVYLDDDEGAAPFRCWRPAVLLRGRSFMFGLEDGELPDLPGKWCHFTQRAAPGAALRRVQP